MREPKSVTLPKTATTARTSLNRRHYSPELANSAPPNLQSFLVQARHLGRSHMLQPLQNAGFTPSLHAGARQRLGKHPCETKDLYKSLSFPNMVRLPVQLNALSSRGRLVVKRCPPIPSVSEGCPLAQRHRWRCQLLLPFGIHEASKPAQGRGLFRGNRKCTLFPKRSLVNAFLPLIVSMDGASGSVPRQQKHRY